MTDPYARELVQSLINLLYQCDWPDGEKFYAKIEQARDYLKNTELREQISEEENDKRFRKCMNIIKNLKPGELTEFMGEDFMEKFRRVSQ
jgi:phage/plasmid-associated DNA primase